MGTQEALPFEQPSLVYEPKILRSDLVKLVAYFDSMAREDVESKLLHWCTENAPEVKVSWQLQVSEDWLAEWKKHFKPFELAGFWFVPSWEKPPKKVPAKQVIKIEPGMAFGTGTHATTRFGIQILRELAKRNRIQRKSVIDVGSGSGILAVVADRLGARSVLAIDSDPECWRESRKTFRLNKSAKCKVSKKQSRQINETYDVVIANIIDGVLISIREDLWRMTKPGGVLVLSGILADGASAFIDHFMHGYKGRVLKEMTDGEWTAYLISK
jgi:ribosomal protein L11 methyltransferase